jgi:hypothetical protein
MRRNDRSAPNGAVAVDVVVAQFGRDVGKKLRTGLGSQEDHLRGPFERMLTAVARSLGLTVTVIGETRLPELAIRPDYAIDVDGARVGYVELKKPGHGVPTTWSTPSRHDREQWEKFQLLPNVLYADGEQFARFSFGKLQGNVGRLTPSLDSAGGRLAAVDMTFGRVLTDFLLWQPERPRTLDELVRLTANLCRLLRDDVDAELERERTGLSHYRTFSSLATDWQQVLFPNLTAAQFADQYSQTVTFALLLARVEGVSFAGRSIGEIARLLGKKHSLMGRALTVLTDQDEENHSVALTTMVRVLSVVDWSDFPDDSYSMLYENFLAKYDPSLRRKSGVYYTPAPLVSFMTRFVDTILRDRLDRRLGFAERDVIVVDPAMGTGSFLAEVVNTVARTVEAEEGLGAVGPQLRELSERLIGFENQAAPYAVAELRIHSLLRKRHRADIPAHERRFLADTLDDPNVQILPMGHMYEAIERSRRGANQVKRDEPMMVVIGNPPYADRAKGSSSWIETPSTSLAAAPSLSAFRKPRNGRLEYVLSNKYVYFWRWATWKAFDAHPAHPSGVVAMVCSSGFATGPGFAGMREYLRRTADEGWIVDLTPEGHQPPMTTRFFRGNQQPICIAILIRRGNPNPDSPAELHWASVSGTSDQKADSLTRLRLDDPSWQDCANGWSEPLTPPVRSSWESMPLLADLFPWTTPGVKPNRAWVYAPETVTLQQRWNRLVTAPMRTRKALLKETRDRRVGSPAPPLPGVEPHRETLASGGSRCPDLIRVAHRSFDRKWLLADARLLDTARPALWVARSSRQIFITEQHAQPISDGPAVVISSDLPDMHHHSGRGGRVLTLFRDAEATRPNLPPGLLKHLSEKIDAAVNAEDFAAYVAAVVSHPGFTRIFVNDLKTPGVRLPLSLDPQLWADAVDIGREVVWLHTFGERFAESVSRGESTSPRIAVGRPTVRIAIPDDVDSMPNDISYHAESRTLHVGRGRIAPVAPDVWSYQVAGMPIVKHWFGYRRRRPSGVHSSPLDEIVATSWTPSMTSELLDLLNVLGRCTALQEKQETLLRRILEGPRLTVDDLTIAGVLPTPPSCRKAPTVDGDTMF